MAHRDDATQMHLRPDKALPDEHGQSGTVPNDRSTKITMTRTQSGSGNHEHDNKYQAHKYGYTNDEDIKIWHLSRRLRSQPKQFDIDFSALCNALVAALIGSMRLSLSASAGSFGKYEARSLLSYDKRTWRSRWNFAISKALAKIEWESPLAENEGLPHRAVA